MMRRSMGGNSSWYGNLGTSSDGDDRKPLEEMLNFLSTNKEVILKNTDILSQFEQMTSMALLQNYDPKLQRILKDCGWIGSSFHDTDDVALDVEYCIQSLSNYYLQQSQSKPGVSSLSFSHSMGSRRMDVTENAVPYCPDLLVDVLMENPITSESKAGCMYFWGACVLADMSGFSKLSGALCSQGVGGLDELRATTSGFLGDLVATVYKHGGDVVAFAGDALICAFPGTPPTSRSYLEEPPGINGECCRSALLCACELSKYENKNLSTHIGVTFGEMNFAMLGGLNKQWVYVLAGDCVSELAKCIDDAGPKEVVCTSRCVEKVLDDEGVHFHFLKKEERHPSGNFCVDMREIKPGEPSPIMSSTDPFSSVFLGVQNRPPSVRQAGARPVIIKRRANIMLQKRRMLRQALMNFVPSPIKHALHSDSFDVLGELRKVTTLFLSLDSYRKNVEGKDPLLLQPFLEIAQRHLHASGGFLRQFLVDDKGCVFIAMWGMPAFTYANNGSRALYCASSIMNEVKSKGYQCSIGIATGMVYCGCVGAPERTDYVGIGTDVNIAARLMSKAKGRILVDPTTYANLNKAAKELLQPGQELHLKGMTAPMTPFIYSTDQIPTLNEPDEHLGSKYLLQHKTVQVLSKHLDRLSSGNRDFEEDTALRVMDDIHTILFILGASGSGKSAACSYFRHSSHQRNIACIMVQAQSIHKGVPFAVMRELFMELVGKTSYGLTGKALIQFLVDNAFPDEQHNEDFLQDAYESLERVVGLNWTENVDDEVLVALDEERSGKKKPLPPQGKLDPANRMQSVNGDNTVHAPFLRKQISTSPFKRQVSTKLNSEDGKNKSLSRHDASGNNSNVSIVSEGGNSTNSSSRTTKNIHAADSSRQSSSSNAILPASPSNQSERSRSSTEGVTFKDDAAPPVRGLPMSKPGIRPTDERTVKTSSIEDIMLDDSAPPMRGLPMSRPGIRPVDREESKMIRPPMISIAGIRPNVDKEEENKEKISNYTKSQALSRTAPRGGTPVEVDDDDDDDDLLSAPAGPMLARSNATTTANILNVSNLPQSPPPMLNRPSAINTSNTVSISVPAASPAQSIVPALSKSVSVRSPLQAHFPTVPEKEFSGEASPKGSDKSFKVNFKREASNFRAIARRTEEHVFHNVLCFLLKDTPRAIIIENGHLCDEISWKLLQQLMEEPGLQISLLVTVLLKNYLADQEKEKDLKLNRESKHNNQKNLLNSIHEEPEPISKETTLSSEEIMKFQISEDIVTDVNVITYNAANIGRLSSSGDKDNSSPSVSLSRGFSATDHQLTPSNSTGPNGTPLLKKRHSNGKESKEVVGSPVVVDKKKIVKQLQKELPLAGIQLLCQAYSEILPLTGLNKEEITEILYLTLKVESVPEELIDLVAKVSSGNPFWCKTIAQFIKQRGLEQFEVVRRSSDANAQDVLKELILCRMETLPKDEQVILRHASIIGEEFTLKMLNSIIPYSLYKNLVSSLGSLIGHGFLTPKEEYPDHKFAFQNPLIQDTLYSLTPPRDAALIHLSIAECIEVTFADNLRSYYPMLGFHYRRSNGNRELAFKYELKAGDQAIERGAYGNGLTFLRTAADYADHRAEMKILIEVIQLAIDDMYYIKKNSPRAGRGVSFMNIDVEALKEDSERTYPEYSKFKKEVEAKLSEKEKTAPKLTLLEHVSYSDERKRELLRSRGVSAKLNWQPSYVQNRRTSITNTPSFYSMNSGGEDFATSRRSSLRDSLSRQDSEFYDTSSMDQVAACCTIV